MKITLSAKGLMIGIVGVFLLGVVADAYINTHVTKQMCMAQRETKQKQAASPAQKMKVAPEFNPQKVNWRGLIIPLPAKRLVATK